MKRIKYCICTLESVLENRKRYYSRGAVYSRINMKLYNFSLEGDDWIHTSFVIFKGSSINYVVDIGGVMPKGYAKPQG